MNANKSKRDSGIGVAGTRVVCLLLVLVGGGAQVPDPGERRAGSYSSLSREMLAAHNAVRAREAIAPLVWSDRLAAVAQDWADNLVKRRQLAHRPKSNYGENLFAITGASATPGEVVGEWAAEAGSYDYRSNKCRGDCLHYTQLVWRNTKELGCAVAAREGREVWVCNYDPPGNWAGERPY